MRKWDARSIAPLLATVWFAYNGLLFAPNDAGVYAPSGPFGLVVGEPGAVAATLAARTGFIGLAMLSAAFVEWAKVIDWVTRPFVPKSPDTAALVGPREG